MGHPYARSSSSKGRNVYPSTAIICGYYPENLDGRGSRIEHRIQTAVGIESYDGARQGAVIAALHGDIDTTGLIAHWSEASYHWFKARVRGDSVQFYCDRGHSKGWIDGAIRIDSPDMTKTWIGETGLRHPIIPHVEITATIIG